MNWGVGGVSAAGGAPWLLLLCGHRPCPSGRPSGVWVVRSHCAKEDQGSQVGDEATGSRSWKTAWNLLVSCHVGGEMTTR